MPEISWCRRCRGDEKKNPREECGQRTGEAVEPEPNPQWGEEGNHRTAPTVVPHRFEDLLKVPRVRFVEMQTHHAAPPNVWALSRTGQG